MEFKKLSYHGIIFIFATLIFYFFFIDNPNVINNFVNNYKIKWFYG